MTTVRIGLIGDRSEGVRAHAAIPQALALAAAGQGHRVEPVWLPTSGLRGAAPEALSGLHGAWCVPGSPYEDMEGALEGIRHARTAGLPFLGTCGGFQHALVEYARNVLDLAQADHAETSPGAEVLVIIPLECSLVGRRGTILLEEGSRARQIYGETSADEEYRCRFGLNPACRPLLEEGGLRFTGFDEEGEVRVAELPGHPFFVATLFQPELHALAGRAHPLVEAFLQAALREEGNRRGCPEQGEPHA